VAIRSDYAPKNDRLTVNATTKETPDTARNHGAPGHWLFVASNSEFVEASEWPVWFGIRLARLVGIVDDWQGQGAPSDALQTLLHQEILTLDIHGDAIL